MGSPKIAHIWFAVRMIPIERSSFERQIGSLVLYHVAETSVGRKQMVLFTSGGVSGQITGRVSHAPDSREGSFLTDSAKC